MSHVACLRIQVKASAFQRFKGTGSLSRHKPFQSQQFTSESNVECYSVHAGGCRCADAAVLKRHRRSTAPRSAALACIMMMAQLGLLATPT